MEKLKTRNEYVGCNNKCRFYADEIRATSYKHWDFVKVINGKVIFNDYNYSSTTTRHQWAIKSLLRELGIKIDAYVYMESSLGEYSFKNKSLRHFYEQAIWSIVQNNTKRVQKKTKAINNSRIKTMKERIKTLREMGAEFSFKEMLSIYRRAKNNRDRREEFIVESKGLVKSDKVYMNLNTKKMYEVVNKNIKNRCLTLKELGKRGNYYTTIWTNITDFNKYYKENKLAKILAE